MTAMPMYRQTSRYRTISATCSGVAPQGTRASVLKYDFVRPDDQATTLTAVRLGEVYSGAGSQPPILGGD
jgi:hypothetical protein